MKLADGAQGLKLRLDWPSVWRVNCVVSRGECKGSEVSGVGGRRARAEFAPRLALSMDSKMCGFAKGNVRGRRCVELADGAPGQKVTPHTEAEAAWRWAGPKASGAGGESV